MVNNKLNILDEGQIKMCPETINMKKPYYYYDFENEIDNMNLCFGRKELAGKNLQEKCLKRLDTKSDHDNYNELIEQCNEYKNNEILYSFLWSRTIEICNYNTNKICKYYNIIPFTPSVMINISPDWSGIKRTNTNKITILKTIFDNYMKEGWYDRWEYVIENGSKGDHIHLHAVCHMNVQRLKSTETHLKKGNHSQQLKKHASKLKGMEGILKGNGIQKTFLRTEELVKDKLEYLHEDTKPEGHKNHSVIENGYVVGCL